MAESETVKFSIYLNDLFRPSAEGPGSAVISPSMLKIPADVLYGAPATLEELINMVGPLAVKMNWYAKASGSVSEHACFATYSLHVWGDAYVPPATTGGQSIPSVVVWETEHMPSQGTQITGDWVKMTGPTDKVLRQVYTDDECDDTSLGCGCFFPTLGGWKDAMISIRVDVEVAMVTYCTTGTHIHDDMCYNFIANYIDDFGVTQQISTYMGEYCKAQYPDGDLSMFNSIEAIGDEKDYHICACNMPLEYYDEFYRSAQGEIEGLNIGSIKPACLFPPCVTSSFMPLYLEKCPVPQCLNVVVLDGNDIQGDVDVNQEANCEMYGITEESASSSGTPSTPTDSESKSKIPSWVWWVVGAIAGLLLLAALGGLGYYLVNKNKGAPAGTAAVANASTVSTVPAVSTTPTVPAATPASLMGTRVFY